MKNVLIVSQNFYPEIGSAANRMKNIFFELHKKGYNVHVLTTEPSYPNQYIYQDRKYFNNEELNILENTHIHRLTMKHEKQKDALTSRLYYYIEFMIKVHVFVKQSEHLFDTIYVSSPNIFAAWGVLFLKEINSTKVLEIRDLWPDSVVDIGKININVFLPILKYLELQMYRKSDKIIINNPAFENHIRKMVKHKPVLFLPNAMNENEHYLDEKHPEFTVGYTGNIGYAQGIEDLKRLSLALNENNIHFNVIPYGVHANEFRTFIKEQHLEYVHAYPVVDRDACLNFLSKCHVSVALLKPSKTFLNVLPGKVIDSICTNVPIITNLGGYTNQLINDNLIGFAKKDANINEIIEQILSLKNDSSKLREYVQNTEKVKDSQFLWRKNIDKLIKFIEE
ncbi:glycosyltransferase family 4 protein [Macrococcoides canis]|uniref:glycosyltransferase family 4 protein n=1 Tax=Macrococcoides canis TaxID=1855823 RepID=UPI00165DAC0A|nr:glycosyltransferase family 4 protein [Macrococcus canis]QNR07494.1 glycosyltransferase WbuB [Macrococcus canis]